MAQDQKPNKKQIKLHIPQDLSAVYSNLAVMSTTRNEMIIDFAQLLPPDPRAKVQSRVILSPQHAKLLLTLLQRNIDRYEAKNGEIEVDTPPSLADQLFQGIQPDTENDDDNT